MSEVCHRCRGTGCEPDWRGLGRRVRDLRVKQGIGLNEAARRLKVCGAYISDLERGNRSWQGPKARALLNLVGLREALP